MSAVAYDGRRLGAGIADGGAGVDLEFARAMKEALTYLLSSWIRIASRSVRRGTLSALGKPNIVVGSPPEFKEVEQPLDRRMSLRK